MICRIEKFFFPLTLTINNIHNTVTFTDRGKGYKMFRRLEIAIGYSFHSAIKLTNNLKRKSLIFCRIYFKICQNFVYFICLISDKYISGSNQSYWSKIIGLCKKYFDWNRTENFPGTGVGASNFIRRALYRIKYNIHIMSCFIWLFCSNDYVLRGSQNRLEIILSYGQTDTM